MSLNSIIKDILKATNGVLLQGDLSVPVRRISIDSRNFNKGDCFIAIPGKNFDGHDFVKDVAHKAGAILVSRPHLLLPHNKPVIYVRDTIKALGEIASAHRKRFRIPVIAITGSSGKTTTKELTATILGKRYHVLSNLGTQNNHIGVPLTLLRLTERHEVAILELGTNQFGDIEWLTHISYPTVAVYTTIGESHLECLKNPLGVLEEKLDLIRNMSPEGKVIFNTDNRYLRRIKEWLPRDKITTFGIHNPSHIKASHCHFVNNERLRFRVNNKYSFFLQTPVYENIYNALAAMACGRLLKVSYNNIGQALKNFKFLKGRQVIQKIKDVWLIDDTYNANPVSFRSAIGTLDRLQVPGKKILVCGDMLELGTKSRQLHRRVGQIILKSNIDMIFTFGHLTREISTVVRRQGNDKAVFHFRSLEALHKTLKFHCQRGDAILVKGSRAMGLERTIEFLNKNVLSRN